MTIKKIEFPEHLKAVITLEDGSLFEVHGHPAYRLRELAEEMFPENMAFYTTRAATPVTLH